MAPQSSFKANTPQYASFDEGSIGAGDDIPFALVQWFVKAALKETEIKGILLFGDWATLAGHLHNYMAAPPEVVLGYPGQQSQADLRATITNAASDQIPLQMAGWMATEMVQCVAQGTPTWVPIQAEKWKKEREERERVEADRKLQKLEREKKKEQPKEEAPPAAPKKKAPKKPSKTTQDQPAPPQQPLPEPALPTTPVPSHQPQIDIEAEEASQSSDDSLEVSPVSPISPSPADTRPNTPEEVDLTLTPAAIPEPARPHRTASQVAMPPPAPRQPRTHRVHGLPRTAAAAPVERPEDRSASSSSPAVPSPKTSPAAPAGSLGSIVEKLMKEAEASAGRHKRSRH